MDKPTEERQDGGMRFQGIRRQDKGGGPDREVQIHRPALRVWGGSEAPTPAADVSPGEKTLCVVCPVRLMPEGWEAVQRSCTENQATCEFPPDRAAKDGGDGDGQHYQVRSMD